MKKIDLHIHTISVNGKDANFNFDLTKLQKYVDELSIDAIAITNHNLFDLEQFTIIEKALHNAVAFPGVEIDFESGHLLLIDGSGDVNDFNNKCQLINTEVGANNQITISKLKEIFVDLNKYLLIPHYDKKRNVSQDKIDLLKDFIIAGEVQSPKKFNRIIKEPSSLTPVLFSDARISEDLDIEKYHGKQTYINVNSTPLTINNIKIALRDKNKLFLTKTGKQGFFQISNDGQELSYGLNVVLGKRSSGKTHFLNHLKKIFSTEDKSITYIKQGSLIKNDDKKFNEILKNEKSVVREKYLLEFKSVVEDAISINWQKTSFNLEKYIDTLTTFASSESQHDEFSRAVLYTENLFYIKESKEIVSLIKAIKVLIDSNTHKATINKYISESNLQNLLDDFKNKFIEETLDDLKKKWINNLIINIRKKLEHNSSSSRIEDDEIDFYDIKIKKEKIKKFSAISNKLREEEIIDEDISFDKFKIRAIATKYNGAGELKEECNKVVKFSPAFQKYEKPILFLEELKKIDGLERSELYKYFCKVTYQVLNEFNREVSGGERAEFNLLKALQDARQYDMLLVDEPESSFDNLFLKDNVNIEIKNISKNLPVVVVTHNNTVGMLMKPDYILYTQREINGDKDEYNIFSGSPGDKEFKTADGAKAIDSYTTLLDSLEAGEVAYFDRNNLYNNFKK